MPLGPRDLKHAGASAAANPDTGCGSLVNITIPFGPLVVRTLLFEAFNMETLIGAVGLLKYDTGLEFAD